MKYRKRLDKIIIAFILVCVTAFYGNTAYAEKTTIPDGFVIADADGNQASKNDGGYMVTASDIAPGDIIIKNITLQNLEQEGSAYDLYMTAKAGEHTGLVNLIEKSSMVIELDNAEIYSGPVDGIDGGLLQSNALSLGTYNSGDTRVAKITITIDDGWSIGQIQSKATFRWNFQAIKNEQTVPSKTGQIITYALYILCGLMLVALCFLYFIYRKRNKKERL